jgi:hypothetical protein
MGPGIFEDCLRDFAITSAIGSVYGDWLWPLGSLGGGATVSHVNPAAATEIGILRLTTAAAADAGAVWNLNGGSVKAVLLSVGLIWAAKLQMSTGTTSYEVWSGLCDAGGSRVRTSDAVNFVGLRSTGGNLFGVVKDGSGSGNESTVDLGVDCEGTWRKAGFEYTEDGIQFFTLASDRYVCERTNVGAPVSTNIPSTGLGLQLLGVVATAASARAADIDWWDLGGRIAR